MNELRPSKFFSGFQLKKLPMCGMTEDSPEARVYFEWPTVTDFKRMVESLPTGVGSQRIFRLARLESTSFSVVQSLRLTLENGFKSPHFGKRQFNSEWNAPAGGCTIQSIRVRHQRDNYIEAIQL